MEEMTDLCGAYESELIRLRDLIADAARVIQDKGYCEDAFDALMDEWYRADYADLGEYLEDDERHGLATRVDYNGSNYVPFQ